MATPAKKKSSLKQAAKENINKQVTMNESSACGGPVCDGKDVSYCGPSPCSTSLSCAPPSCSLPPLCLPPPSCRMPPLCLPPPSCRTPMICPPVGCATAPHCVPLPICRTPPVCNNYCPPSPCEPSRYPRMMDEALTSVPCVCPMVDSLKSTSCLAACSPDSKNCDLHNYPNTKPLGQAYVPASNSYQMIHANACFLGRPDPCSTAVATGCNQHSFSSKKYFPTSEGSTFNAPASSDGKVCTCAVVDPLKVTPCPVHFPIMTRPCLSNSSSSQHGPCCP